MVDLILFPSSYFSIKKVDEDLQSEYDAVKATGLFDTLLFGYDKWVNEGVLALDETPPVMRKAIMRGWMMKPQQVMNEKENAELQKIKESANAEFERMKVELKRQASEGHYVDLSTRQIVHTEITSDIHKYCDIVTRKGM